MKRSTHLGKRLLALALVLCTITIVAFAAGYSRKVTTNIFVDGKIYSNKTEFAWSVEGIGNLSDLKLLEDEFYSAENENLFFTVNCDQLNADVQLYDENNSFISQMFDDGSHGDAIANDGVYSYSYTYRSNKATRISYYAKSGDSKSNIVIAHFYGAPPTDHYTQYEDIITTIAEIEQPYVDENGNMLSNESADQAFADVLDYLKAKYNDFSIIKMVVNDRTIEFTLPYGLMIVYEPSFADCLSIGSSTYPVITVLTTKEFASGYPFRHKVKDAATYMVDGLGHYTYNYPDNMFDIKEGDQISLFAIQDQILRPDSVILWVGHAGPLSDLGCGIGTTEKYTEQTLDKYSRFSILKKRDYVLSSKGLIFFTPNFVRNNCDLTGSFVYFQCCVSAEVGTKDSMIQACVDVGVDAYAGNVGTTEQAYAYGFLYDVITRMTDTDPSTDKLYTLGQAQEYAYSQPYFDIFGSSYYAYNEIYRFEDNIPSVTPTPEPEVTPTVTPVSTSEVTGIVIDSLNSPLNEVTVSVLNKGLTAVTDENGGYLFELPVGTYTLVFERSGYQTVEKEINVSSENLGWSYIVDAVVLIEDVQPDIEVTGSVVDESNNNIAGATVTVEGKSISVTTDINGEFTLELPVGRYTLLVEKEGYLSKEQDIEVVNMENFVNILDAIVLESAPEIPTVSGTVIDSKNQPLSDVTLTVMEGIMVVDEINVSGSFSISNLTGSEYTFVFSKEGYQDKSVEVNIGTEKEISLGDIVLYEAVNGKVIGTFAPTPITLKLHVLQNGEVKQEFSFTNELDIELLAGEYVFVFDPDGQPFRRKVVVEANQVTDLDYTWLDTAVHFLYVDSDRAWNLTFDCVYQGNYKTSISDNVKGQWNVAMHSPTVGYSGRYTYEIYRTDRPDKKAVIEYYFDGKSESRIDLGGLIMRETNGDIEFVFDIPAESSVSNFYVRSTE